MDCPPVKNCRWLTSIVPGFENTISLGYLVITTRAVELGIFS